MYCVAVLLVETLLVRFLYSITYIFASPVCQNVIVLYVNARIGESAVLDYDYHAFNSYIVLKLNILNFLLVYSPTL